MLQPSFQRVDSLLNFKSFFFLEGCGKPLSFWRSGSDESTGHLLDGITGGAYVPTVFVGMYATQGRYNVWVLKHYYDLNHLHYLTTRTYRRARRFDSERSRKQGVATFGEVIRN